MFDKLLFIFLIISPVCFAGGADIFQYADRFLMAGIMGLGCLSLIFCKPKRFILPKWPLFLILFLIAKLYYLPYNALSMHGLFNVFFCVGLFYLVANYAQDIRWLYRAIGAVVIINLIYVFSQALGFDPVFNSYGVPCGFFANNSDLAGYLILATPLMARFAFGAGFFVPFIPALFLCSFSAIISNLISGLLIASRKGLYPMVFIIILGLSIGAFIKQKPYNLPYKLKYRVEIWAPVVKAAITRPLAGWGLGRGIELTAKSGQGSFTAKSDYLEYALEVGLFTALVTFIYIFSKLVLRYIQADKGLDLHLIGISLLAFAISLIAQSHLRNPKIAPTVMAILGWLYILTEQKGAVK